MLPKITSFHLETFGKGDLLDSFSMRQESGFIFIKSKYAPPYLQEDDNISHLWS